ncbi:MAG: DNA translocase FtsK [Alistipes sp.]|nr:DNA translocase FtsK [Alistipes senegalensis]MCM1250122.1 DNA translocase FtsK [Alistipes sp.]
MASHNSTSSRTPQQHGNSDSARWIVGLLLLFFGLFVAVALFSSFFCWKEDLSVLQRSADERELFSMSMKNWCGGFGARLGYWLVDSSLGVFGILVPLVVMLLGARIIRQRPLLLNHSVLVLSLVMIFGSLTLGFAFGTHWSVCCSSGWGGAFGIRMSEILSGYIGSFGMVILLLVCWILIGVFINRDFIHRVNSAVDRSEEIVRNFRKFRHKTPSSDVSEFDADADAFPPRASVRPAPSAAPVRPQAPQPAGEFGEPWISRPQESADEYRPEVPAYTIPPRTVSEAAVPPVPAPAPAPVASAVPPVPVPPVATAAAEDEDPFEEITRVVPGAEKPHAEEPAGPVIVAQDDEFIEFDLSNRQRLVMGRGGLVELDRPTVPQPVVDGPFTEISMTPKTPPQPAEPQILEEPSDPDEPYLMSVPVPPAQPVPPARPRRSQQPLSSQPLEAPVAEQGVVVTVETNEAPMVDERAISTEAYDPLKDLVNYRKPPVTLLEDYVSDSEVSSEEIFENKSRIEETLKYFGIPIQRIKATVGPTVTLYEIVQAQGVKISKIQGLENDIAQSLKALGIRIIAPIPGKGTIGIEVPNRDKQVVSMYSAVRSVRFQESKAELPVVIGRTIQNENYVFDLAKMPHLLVAGATGQGKSVGLNAIITSLLYRKHPAQLKFVMIDPKMVEFSLYAKLERHFLAKMESEDKAIITDPMKAVYTLNSLCTEMDKRLELCSDAGARNIVEYNEKFTARRLNPNKGHRYMPYIVVVVDEFADLIMMAREVERPVMRLAQKARAVGIHLIIATQRPDVKVITGGIKANFPARIAFRVMQMIDSRTIIDQPGANQLIGRGDMLFSKDGELVRIQCALVETRDVERVVEHISRQQGYPEPYPLPDYVPEGGDSGMGSEEAAAPVKYDVLFGEIARNAVESGSISTSMIQRNYEVGFNRAGRIMMQLERAGIVGRQIGAKPRDILFHDLPSLEAKLQELGVF